MPQARGRKGGDRGGGGVREDTQGGNFYGTPIYCTVEYKKETPTAYCRIAIP